MANNSKFLAGIITGIAAGAAITLLLNTESGKKILADVKDAAGKALRDLQSRLEEDGEETESAV